MNWSVTSCHMSTCISWVIRELLCSKQQTPYISHRPLGLSHTQRHTGDKGRARGRASLRPWSSQPAQWPWAIQAVKNLHGLKKCRRSLVPHFPYSFVFLEKMQALSFEREWVHVSVKAVDTQLWDKLRQHSPEYLSDTPLLKCSSLTSSLASRRGGWS